MFRRPRIVAGGAGVIGTVLVGVGIVYLSVACQDLPGILGPTPGHTSPRTPLGLAVLLLGLLVLGVAVVAARRRPPV
jgi:hypothetical protein